ncbi:unnamed protein product [Orchesella dallaii]|uniref:C-type lectin domain-containing protein n=1 Tax=Orchesella dallaii TaxID=48710 RepID=A0ABP1R3H0_9HEXA
MEIKGFVKSGNADCPESDQNTGMQRVGNTRYFIYHMAGRRDLTMFRNWTEAKERCSETGFKMATIENMANFAEVARALEGLVEKERLRDTWYWLDATYNEDKEEYFWGGDLSRPVAFSNFFYRFPRPTGIGSHFRSIYGQPDRYDVTSNVSQCLALALPLPSNTNRNNPSAVTFGHSATFDERPCEGSRKRHAICESTLPECTDINVDPFSLHKGRLDYFEKGNWIIGNRKYIVNWQQKTINDSMKYCTDLGLKLYDPTKDSESCLIPHLKMWSRNITVSQFWTSWSYVVSTPGRGDQGIFMSADGKQMARVTFWSNITDQAMGRSNKESKTLCVAMQHSYEFRGTQLPCDGISGCSWNFIQFVPANCNNFHGTICQESNTAQCYWDKAWIRTPSKYFNNGTRATIEFGYKDNKDAYRSKFKQTFGNLACPPDYRMARKGNNQLFVKPTPAQTNETLYKYDYMETYWVIDGERFKKGRGDAKCTISIPTGDGHTRKHETVPCTQWNFYLCEKITTRIRPFEGTLRQIPDPKSYFQPPLLVQAKCVAKKGKLTRLGKTRFYIAHKKKRGDYVDWNAAKKLCEKQGFKMAKITKLTTMASVSRILEKYVDENRLKDSWYWLNAKYDEKQENYVWLDNNKPLEYTNYFYRQPRPIGVGSHMSAEQKYKLNKNLQQCLTLAMPLSGLADTEKNPGCVIFGHATTFDESACENIKKRHAICESSDESCNEDEKNPFALSEDKDAYFNDGNWIVGDRKYIVNWKQRSYEDSVAFCRSLGLKLFNPEMQEDCLVPYLKLWSRFVTISQFWTAWRYIAKTTEFKDVTGKVLAVGAARVNFTERSSKRDSSFCVAMQHFYEFKESQMPCPKNDMSACDWNFVQYVPANCKTYLGTICQQDDCKARKCEWSKEWIDNVDQALAKSATVVFGWKENYETYRSTYKQTFGSLLCPRNYRMVRGSNKNWYRKPEVTTQLYSYDYLETYWILDEEGFKKDKDSKCIVSAPSNKDGSVRKNVTVSCTEWNFYLCEMQTKPQKPFTEKLPYEIPKTEWSEKIQERIYPIMS